MTDAEVQEVVKVLAKRMLREGGGPSTQWRLCQLTMRVLRQHGHSVHDSRNRADIAFLRLLDQHWLKTDGPSGAGVDTYFEIIAPAIEVHPAIETAQMIELEYESYA